jgi:small-conductance mechanosensitive channel
VLDIHWIGLTQQNGQKLLLSALFVAALIALRALARGALRLLGRGESKRAVVARFWGHQAINAASLAITVLVLISIWFDDPARLATALGLVGAGLAFALQRVITAFAGYVVILNSGIFAVGDRINMGGVRGDVLSLGFMQTTLMEMGVAPGSDAGPSVWVKSRQFTGRIVTISNAKIFDDPVYNYTRDFPYIWEEVRVPIRYGDDRGRAEAILLDAARRYALDPATMSEEAASSLERRFDVRRLDFEPRVYYSLTSNYLELTVRFVFRDHGTRAVKDQMARTILDEFAAAGITIAAAALRIQDESPSSPGRGEG